MSKISDLIAAESTAAQRPNDAEVPVGTISRGHDRSKVLQVRLNEDELRLLAKLADERHLPVSTFVRAIVLDAIGS